MLTKTSHAGAAPFKQGMRALVGAVTVVAVQDVDGFAAGLTATAVCSLSVEPPSLLVCVNRTSTIAPGLKQDDSFSVNVLADDQVDVAQAFGGQKTVKGSARFYRGQAFELMVPIDASEIDDDAIAGLCERFHDLHLQRFSFADRAETIELVTLRLAATGRLDYDDFGWNPSKIMDVMDPKSVERDQREKPVPTFSHPAPGDVAVAPAPTMDGVAMVRRRLVYLSGQWTETPIYEQGKLGAGARVTGPAVIEQPYTTLLIPRGWTLAVALSGDLVASQGEAQ